MITAAMHADCPALCFPSQTDAARQQPCEADLRLVIQPFTTPAKVGLFPQNVRERRGF